MIKAKMLIGSLVLGLGVMLATPNVSEARHGNFHSRSRHGMTHRPYRHSIPRHYRSYSHIGIHYGYGFGSPYYGGREYYGYDAPYYGGAGYYGYSSCRCHRRSAPYRSCGPRRCRRPHASIHYSW